MEAIKNTITLIQENWTNILIVISVVIVAGKKVMEYIKMTKEERVEAALKIIKAELLKLMSDAEIEWEEYKKSGEIKKSQVITEIYSQFPFLKDYIDQDELIKRIIEMIDEEKEKMDKVINNNEISPN